MQRMVFLCTLGFSSLTLAQPAPAPAPTPAPAAHDEHGEAKPGQLFTELFVGDKIYVQDKGEWYFILEAAYAKASNEKEYEFAAEVIYGLTDQIQLFAEVPFLIVDPNNDSNHVGVGDVSLGITYNFVQERNYALGLRGTVTLPTGDENRDLGGGQFTYAPAFQSAFRVGDGEIYASIGGIFGDNHPDLLTYSIAGAYPWRGFVGVVELSGLTGNHTDVLYATPGIYWTGHEGIELGVGVPIGLTHDSDDFQVIVKFVFEL